MEIKHSIFERKAIPILVAASIGVMALTGCSKEGPALDKSKPAEVVDHKHEEAYWTSVPVNKIPILTYHEEKFELKLRQCPDGEPNALDCIEGNIDVSKDTYNATKDHAIVIPDVIDN